MFSRRPSLAAKASTVLSSSLFLLLPSFLSVLVCAHFKKSLKFSSLEDEQFVISTKENVTLFQEPERLSGATLGRARERGIQAAKGWILAGETPSKSYFSKLQQ